MHFKLQDVAQTFSENDMVINGDDSFPVYIIFQYECEDHDPNCFIDDLESLISCRASKIAYAHKDAIEGVSYKYSHILILPTFYIILLLLV